MYFKTLWIHTGETVIHTPLQTNPSPKKCAHTRVGSSFTLSSRQIIPTFYREKQYCISLAHACQTWKPLWNIISTFAREIQTSLQIRTSRMKSHTQLYEDRRWLNSPTEDFKHQVTCDTTWSLTHKHIRDLPLKATYFVRTPPTPEVQGPWKPDLHVPLTCEAVVIATKFPTGPSHRAPSLENSTALRIGYHIGVRSKWC